MKTLLICHSDDLLNGQALPAWLDSFSDLVGIVFIDETPGRMVQRIKNEIRRSGMLRFLDVLLFRVYYRIFLSARDKAVQGTRLKRIREAYPDYQGPMAEFHTLSPNTPEVAQFIQSLQPDLIIARCKTLLKKDIYGLAKTGTFVMHPGICPEYRNAHGCFWALASNDLDKVGMTLLKIDDGVDTGPVYGYFYPEFDELRDSHITIQDRTVFDNLDAIRQRLQEIYLGKATPIDTQGRPSGVWGQPWMSQYLKWKRAARKRQQAGRVAPSLLYHDVVEQGKYESSGFDSPDANIYKLDRDAFVRQLNLLQQHYPQVDTRLPQGKSRAQQASQRILFTFDDGGKSAITEVADLLESRGWIGYFFITTDKVGEAGFMTADDIRELDRRGHVIGSHSHTHPPNISALSDEQIAREWETSCAILGDMIGKQISCASVPGGFYSDKVKALAFKAGIRHLFTSEPNKLIQRDGDGYLVGRYAINNATRNQRVVDLASGTLNRHQLFQTAFWNFKKALKWILGDTYIRIRKFLLK
ncbi:polysaccharide deacetylase family protein [Thiolapillus brandeum]|nr:polysaccharide deacetylase family protein [Thiolapillus brandeum]